LLACKYQPSEFWQVVGIDIVVLISGVFIVNRILEKWQDEFLLLDFEHPFLADTIEEELILFGRQDFGEIVSLTTTMFAGFKTDFVEKQSLQHLSGGERAALALILYFNLALSLGKPVKILLYNILESLSQTNQTKLLDMLAELDNEHSISLYNLKNDKPEKLN